MGFKRVIAKTAFKLKKKSPEICLALGIVGFGATVVLACKATMKADEVLDKYEADKEKVEEAKKASAEEDGLVYSEKDAKKDTAIAMRDMVFGFAKLYAPAAAVGLISVGLILNSYRIINGRFLSAMGAYTALDETFKKYRARVADRFGEEAEEEIRTGVKNAKGFVKEADENGEEKVVEKEVPTIDEVMMGDVSDYGVIFNKSTSTQWQSGGSLYNESFLKAQQAYFNNWLQTRGFVFLSEVKTALGMQIKPQDVLVGWIKDSAVGDNYVDFGIRGPVYTEGGDHVLNTGRIVQTLSSDGYYLDFNVDGAIWNLI